jgi:L-alanine-DL-glutamate epimerase-like enolase superfamily enzyme
VCGIELALWDLAGKAYGVQNVMHPFIGIHIQRARIRTLVRYPSQE